MLPNLRQLEFFDEFYEMKRYTPQPDKAVALHARFASKTIPIFRRLGIELMHCWTSKQEPGVL